MNSMHRYYCAHALTVGADITIGGSEAHHLLHVMRGSSGQRITLFDGQGAEFIAEIRDRTRRDVTVHVVQQVDADRELGFQLTVGCALPKGDRQRFLLEKLVELGVTRFVALQTHRSVVKPTTSVCQRLRRAVVEASKQCGRNRLMEVTDGLPCADYLAADFVCNLDVTRLIAHPSEAGQCDASSVANVALAVGPEGGFTDEELTIARQHHWQPVSLGRRTLRIETAAIALTAKFVL